MIRIFTSEITINANKNYIFEISNNLKCVLILLIVFVSAYFVIKIICNTSVKIKEINKVDCLKQQNSCKDGISIIGAEKNEKGHLILTLSNKQIIDAGKVVGLDGNDVEDNN